ncbi:UDP-N-acetylmuramoyl-tripeptide--D-alanyl-D-alanine ligase [Actinoplanes oblitus]|uniref:UDP-N-acetylmuramoyl-tripeptide--D-alanyl-D-alanine ligase n=1 Tax=Actinoplanes oblitus TaxID=3040509 RepID=A0ABY8WDL8_9ACTN|nr:UDP-N-acetylmuramoyl-tripeptide--D-alanyl-D-alanine ligase [Actinoplanes oblitus]WIM94484.1 UDP-N-acetylmuramoyl-tripeptide--D-alanyl-D-alanine ligase [Actinoplanes oblitus]
MIPLSLAEIAEVVAGTVVGDPAVTVTAPAVLDGREAQPGGLFVAFDGERVDGHGFAGQAGRAGAVAVLGSRPTELPTVVVPDARAALQTLAAFVVGRLRDGLTVVGVTGSQGKTSTKDMLAAVLAMAGPAVATVGSLNNELGVPITMLRVTPETRFLVLEMGARHIGDIAKLTDLVALDIAVVLNVGVAHLGEFGSRDAIAKAKGELVQGLVPGGTAVLNADDPRVAAMRSLTDGPVVTFGYGDADVQIRSLTLDRLGRPSFTLRVRGSREVAPDEPQAGRRSDAAPDAPRTDGGEVAPDGPTGGSGDAAPDLLPAGRGSVSVALPFIGAHQAINAATAVAAGLSAGVAIEAAAAALATAELSKWRMELRDLSGGATLINDSYNANPDSTRAALDALAAIAGGRRIAVLGEMRELGDDSKAEHRAIGEYAALAADLVVVVGEAAAPIADGAGERAVALADNDAAIGWLRDHLAAGDVVLVKASRMARLDEVADALGQWTA